MVALSNEPMEERLRRAGIDPKTPHRKELAHLLGALETSMLDLMTIGDLLSHNGPEPDDGSLTAVLAILFSVLSEGSLCLSLEQADLQAGVLKQAAPAVDRMVFEFIRRLDRGCYDRLIERSGQGVYKPLVLDDRSGRRLLYFQKFHYHEQRLKRRLLDFLSAPAAGNLSPETVQAVIDGLYRDEAVIRGGIGKDPIVRDKYQESAIRAALTASLLVISGGPGTGKTSLLANVLRALVGIGTDPSRIVLAAPTGRAAQRMTESMSASLATIAQPDHRDRCLGRLNGATLHKLLVYRTRSHGFWYGEHRHLPADVVVVDEVSMVDVVMMDRLFQAVDPHRTRVILLGDKDQLPSVEAGSVLADMRPTDDGAFADHFIMLEHVYRSGGELLELAQTINAGDAVSPTPVSFDRALARGDGTWSFIVAKDGTAIDRIIDQWVRLQYIRRQDETDDSYVDLVRRLDRLADQSDDGADDGAVEQRMALLGRLFGFAYRCRLLTLLRRGRTGAQRINNRIGSGLRQILDPTCNPDDGWFNGALIMVTRNDYTRELFNGDVGVVLRQTAGTYRVYFRRADGVVDHPASGLPDWDLAFAMTVHKSQGSEFDDTLLMLPETTDHRLLTREIIYTAATRASRRLIVCGNPDAFQTALKRKIHRHSGLGLSSG